MNSINKNPIYLIIMGILIIFLFLNKCGEDNKPTKNNPQAFIDTITIIDTQFIVIERKIPEYIPKWKNKIIRDTLFKDKYIDTLSILSDYFSVYVYEDTIINDTLQLYIKDSITKNKIKNRNINYKLIYPTISKTITINNPPKKKNKFYIGGELIGNNTGINYLGSNLLWKNKKERIYGFGLGINGELKPQLNINTYWKIGKK